MAPRFADRRAAATPRSTSALSLLGHSHLAARCTDALAQGMGVQRAQPTGIDAEPQLVPEWRRERGSGLRARTADAILAYSDRCATAGDRMTPDPLTGPRPAGYDTETAPEHMGAFVDTTLADLFGELRGRWA